MKNLITTCYARAKALDRSIPQVQTSRGAPTWWNAARKINEQDLAPSERVFLMAKNRTPGWKEEYRKQIEKLHAQGRLKPIVDRIPDGAALLCHEADHVQCHRKVLADFLNEKGLAQVAEMPWAPSRQEVQAEQAKKQPDLL